jgi:hypothetical protein
MLFGLVFHATLPSLHMFIHHPKMAKVPFSDSVTLRETSNIFAALIVGDMLKIV